MQENHNDSATFRPLSQDSIAETQRFWADRCGVEMTEDEARETLQNMAAFADILVAWLGHSETTPITGSECQMERDISKEFT